MVCCEDGRRLSDQLQVEYDQLVTAPRAAFKAQVEVGHDGPVFISYHPPQHVRSRIGKIIATRRKISDGWCPVHTAVH